MKYLKRLCTLFIVLSMMVTLSACVGNNTGIPPSPPIPEKQETEDQLNHDDHPTDDTTQEDSNNMENSSEDTGTGDKEQPKKMDEQKVQQPEPIDYEKVKPNELGEIMVIMYHYFGDKEQEFTRTFDNFRKDLQILYDKGYCLISMDDFLSNNIDVPAGKTPVVFTFDDAPASQFNLIEKDGKLEVNPQSAVGIMMDFYQEHPDFGLEGTFYINNEGFAGSKGTEKERLQYLLDLGMDIGNHTFGHTNLGKSDPGTIQKVIGQHVKKMKRYFPDYHHNTLALPYGSYANHTFDYIVKGKYEDIEYEHDAVLLVGWKPSPPPAHKNFYPLKLLRVRAGEGIEHDMYYYLNYFEKHPEMRYVSDGDKDTVCIPEKNKNQLDDGKVGNKKVVIY